MIDLISTRWRKLVTGTVVAGAAFQMYQWKREADHQTAARIRAAKLKGETEPVVVVVGCGISGIAAGIKLKEAGIPFIIIEKERDVGGTWLLNTYPG